MGEHNERFSGHVNARYNVRGELIWPCYLLGMGNHWKTELRQAIAASGMSMRAISRAIGAGPNAVSEIFSTDKEPGIERVLAIIDAIGASRTAVLAGYPMTREIEEIIGLLNRIGPTAQQSALRFLRDLQARSNEPGTQPAPQPSNPDTQVGSR